MMMFLVVFSVDVVVSAVVDGHPAELVPLLGLGQRLLGGLHAELGLLLL